MSGGPRKSKRKALTFTTYFSWSPACQPERIASLWRWVELNQVYHVQLVRRGHLESLCLLWTSSLF